MKTGTLTEYMPNTHRKNRWKYLSTPLAILLAFCVGFGLAETFAAGPANAGGTEQIIIVDPGISVRSVGAKLEQADIIRSALSFRILSRLLGYDTQIKAGEYAFEPGASMFKVLQSMAIGDVLLHPITIPEGWTSMNIAQHLEQSELLIGPMPDNLIEGGYLPDTYLVERGTTRMALLQKMAEAHQQALAQLWSARQSDLPLKNSREAVILASMVETETSIAAELPQVAAVFINRLRQRMRLESDPTIIYGLTGGEPLGRGLRQSEIKRKTPYNTYLFHGLPPTPICNPGAEAIAAVLNPAKSKDLFFVADGKGGHWFAANYDEHRRNVRKWRSIEKTMASK